jgi:hypothetical protein
LTARLEGVPFQSKSLSDAVEGGLGKNSAGGHREAAPVRNDAADFQNKKPRASTQTELAQNKSGKIAS